METSQKESAIEFSPFFEKFLFEMQRTRKDNQTEESAIHTSEIFSGIALVYEKIRNSVEYKDENVLRRNAIERILKRLIWEDYRRNTENTAKRLIRELVWARYLPNNTIPKTKIYEVSKIIDKYFYFRDRLSQNSIKGNKLNLGWIWGICSAEIEDVLDPSSKELFVNLMQEWFSSYFEWENDELGKDEKETQVYLAIHRALAHSDDQILSYHLLIRRFPKWLVHDQKEIDSIASNFEEVFDWINRQLNFSEGIILFRNIKQLTAPFEILFEFFAEEKENSQKILFDLDLFEKKITEICQIKYKKIQQKVNRAVFRSILYIFITKVFIALLIEIPYELYTLGKIILVPFIINLTFPPGMMFLIGSTIRAPGQDNTKKILARLSTIIYKNYEINKSSFSLLKIRQDITLTKIFTALYLVLFAFVFGGISFLLVKLHFTPVALIIFFIFLSLVLLFGFRIRYLASQLKVTTNRESAIEHIFYNFTLPFLSVGFWLSKGLAKLNFFIIILDFLIEAPLKRIIEIIEEWSSFIREKQKEVVEVP